MAVTSPDNIRTPDSGDQYALVQDLGVLADTVQAAITKRGNMYVGTAAQRTAFTTAPAGTHWQDTDGTALEYVRAGGAWLMLGSKFYSGTAAQRTAFTTAPNGSHWQDTDGSKLLYRRDGAAWVLYGYDDVAWVTPAISSPWLNLPANPIKYARRAGYVSLTGQVGGSTANSSIFTLPVGFRPEGTSVWVVDRGFPTSQARIVIGSDGVVSHSASTAGTATGSYFALGSIVFPAA